MKILSLFDGISCGQLALQRQGIHYDSYFSSEINKNQIQVTQDNFPNTIQLGDVTQVGGDLPPIDLLIGGSPCQGFSSAGKRLNFNDPRSKLFFEFIRLLNQINPRYFLLENVVMKKEFQDIISNHLGVEPILINSSLVSGQNRNRFYWTNIKFNLPIDRNIKLKDILEKDFDYNKASITGRRLNQFGKREDYNKNIPITQCLEVRVENADKCNCLTTVDKDNVLTPLGIGRHPDVFKRKLPFRYYSVIEYERLQTIPENYTKQVTKTQAKTLIGNGWTVELISHIFKHLT